jgi:hypothetical protein
MQSHCRIVVYGLALCLLYCQTSVGSTTPLKPGTTTLMSMFNPVGGKMLFLTNINSSSSSFSGILTSSVLLDDSSNPYGGLTFTYQLTCDAVGYTPVSSISINGFRSFLTSVSYETSVDRADDPIQASRTEESLDGGTTLNFDFSTCLRDGQSSACLVVQTSAKSWTWDSSYACFGSCCIHAPSPVPEPTSNKFLVFGLGAMAVSHRRVKTFTKKLGVLLMNLFSANPDSSHTLAGVG